MSIHGDDILIRKEPFETQDPLIKKKEVLKLALEQAAGAMQDITTVHLELLEQLFPVSAEEGYPCLMECRHTVSMKGSDCAGKQKQCRIA